MGNCCSFKRGSGDIETEDAQKILNGITSTVLNHGGGKRHSATITAEMKPLTENKRNSIKSKITISEEDEYVLSGGGLNSNSKDSIIDIPDHNHYYPASSKSTSQVHSYPHTHTRQISTEKVGLGNFSQVGSFGPTFKTPITSIPQHMRMEGFQRAKHNSTSSLYIKSTLSTPDNDEILRLLSALILASKVWEDQSVWNVDFLPVFDNLTATDLNNLERQFLSLIQYNVSLTASVYAKYYFELRTFSKLDSNHFPLKPLDKSGAKRLEDHSQASEYRVKTFKRSASVDQINPPELHTRAVDKGFYFSIGCMNQIADTKLRRGGLVVQIFANCFI
eukprot:gene10923-12730_t